MKPAAFELRRPMAIDEAIAMLADGGDREVKPLAGGQSLIAMMNLRLSRPEVLVDLGELAELRYLDVDADSCLRVGAMTRQRTLEKSSLVRDGWPTLSDALSLVAHVPIRNRGTFGGSLAHADPAAELCAVGLALDARVILRSERGTREVPAGELFLGPFTTILEPDELLTEIVVPPVPPRTGSAFEEMARRRGDFALAGVLAVLTAGPGGTIADARLAYISLGPSAFRSAAAERLLRGADGGADAFAAAAAAAVAEMAPASDTQASGDFRRHLARVLTRRALAWAWARATDTGDGGGGRDAAMASEQD